jgi:hypothetical protein
MGLMALTLLTGLGLVTRVAVERGGIPPTRRRHFDLAERRDGFTAARRTCGRSTIPWRRCRARLLPLGPPTTARTRQCG